MVQFVKIRNTFFDKYLVAGDVWDGAVYLQENTHRANAVWAVRDVGDGYIRLMDLRHGMDLVNGVGTVKGSTHPVANLAVMEMPFDNRAKWKKITEPPNLQYFKIQNGFPEKPYLTGGDGNIPNFIVVIGASAAFSWEFVPVDNVPFNVDRLRLPQPVNRTITINYQVDINNAPGQLKNMGELSINQAIDKAVRLWIGALNSIGLKDMRADALTVAAQRGNPVHIKFCWDQVPNDGELGHVSGRSFAAGMLDRVPPAGEPVTVKFDKNKSFISAHLPGFDYPFAYDLFSAAAHELGHVFGLEHNVGQDSVMQAKLNTGEAFPDTPICGSDRLSLRARYIDQVWTDAPKPDE